MPKAPSSLNRSRSYPDDEEWLTESQAAKMLKVSVSTLQKWRHFGKGLPYSKFGRLVRYALSDILDFMETHRIAPMTAI